MNAPHPRKHRWLDFDRPCDPPYEYKRVKPTGERAIPKPFRSRILVHTVHDGASVPLAFRFRPDGTPLVDPEELEHRYIRERDWGANLVASKLTRALGVNGYARCLVARVLVDFNRFPGSTPPTVLAPLERMAINAPFSEALDHRQKMRLLGDYYDRISELIEEKVLGDKLILIGVHTYDEHNASLTRRPDLSLITQSATYQREARMPFGVFDPMYPDELAESTCSRILRDRVSLNLERSGFYTSHNHPYPFPEGSIEVRAQVWYFFQYLRRRFEADHPETRSDPAFLMVWTMLLNTNLRVQAGEALRGYLHRYRSVPRSQVKRFRDGQAAYDQVRDYLRDSDVVSDYRRSRDRPSTIAIEVRKDLVCTLDAAGRPLPLTGAQEQTAEKIATVIAGALATYFATDRQHI